jgi:hypothetical protein
VLLLNGCVALIGLAVCTEADLLAAAGQRSFDRGTRYLDAVSDLTILGNQVTASVRGNDEYIVVLTLGGGSGVSGVCDCPYGQEGFFCKHCVAVGLAFLRNAGANSAGRRKQPKTGPRGNDRDGQKTIGLHSWLGSLCNDELLRLMLDELVENDDWRRRLELRAAGAAADVESICARLDALLDPAGFGDYGYVEEGESRRYARRVSTAAEIVNELVGSGHAGEAVAVAEHAITLVAAACRHAADPAGAIRAAATSLIACHRAACVAAEAGQEGLASAATPDV